MWNGFQGEYGGKFLPIFVIFITNMTVLAFSRLDKFDFDLIHSYLNITLSFPSFFEIITSLIYLIAVWILFVLVPGKIEIGSVNNSGNRYEYKLNSLSCMLFSMAIQLFLSVSGLVPLETFSKYFDRIGIIFVCLGNFFSVLIYLKGRFYPTFLNNESKKRNKLFEDFYSGIELIPRFSNSSILDIKLFMIGHIGMITWQLFNISHAAYGWNRGNLEALIIFLLQSVYIFDWAYNERWYLYTIDIQHDRLGFYLIFGSFAWMPIIYTTYGYYASHIPMKNSYLMLIFVVSLYLIGFCLMRVSNNQKDMFRKNPEKLIWGKKPKFMMALYQTQDGITRSNKLLLSGFWGWARHFNYVGDLIMCMAISIIFGFHSLGAHIYTITLTAVLITRAFRDDSRCGLKYGEDWKKYREKNPYLLIPRVY